jgi:hypothetical protein
MPLEQAAARQTFFDIADDGHKLEEVDQILSLTDNMPLAINLLAHVAESEGCYSVLSRWEHERTSLISEGYDKRSNLDLSISLSLSSPRIKSVPHSKELLSLLSILPDGLSDVELIQSKLPIDNILGCKIRLIRTALAYSNEHKQLKLLGPIREYMQKILPPGYHLVHPLFKYFQNILEFFLKYHGTQPSSTIVTRISSNFANIQNLLLKTLQLGHPELKDAIYCACHLNRFSGLTGQAPIPLISQIQDILPQPCDYRLESYLITELLQSQRKYNTSYSETLVAKALKHFEHFDDPDLKCKLW